MLFQPKTKYSIQVSIVSVVSAESENEAVGRLISVIQEACRILDKDEVVDLGVNHHFRIKKLLPTKRPAVTSSHQKGGENRG